MHASLGELEAILDEPAVSRELAKLEAALPSGGRPRQLSARTLLLGMLLAWADDRPAHLTRVHEALLGLSEADRVRLSVSVVGRFGEHLCTYRQIEHLHRLVRQALSDNEPTGRPSEGLAALVAALIGASVPSRYRPERLDVALDWSDHASFARPRRNDEAALSDREAAWGHRKGTAPGEDDGLFYGYYLSFATMVAPFQAEALPELIVAMLLSSCRLDPAASFVATLESFVASGVALGDVLVDSGYSYRAPEHFSRPVRALGASLVMDLHPNDRGPKGTHDGAIICNGALFCPATPPALLKLSPPPRDATPAEIASSDRRVKELKAYELGALSADDEAGSHRVLCPAVAGKLVCALREGSLALGFERPEVLAPPEHRPRCCAQVSITVPAAIGEKARQRHLYPGADWRASYARRTASERAHGSTKDRARVDTAKGWCRVMGLTPNTVFLACLVVVRNLRIATAFEAAQADAVRRAARGAAPRRRRARPRRAERVTTAGASRPPP